MIAISASGLGIEIGSADANGLYQWLLASFLIGKRIRSSIAVEAYRVLVDQEGLNTPAKLAHSSQQSLVRMLGRAGYARYDESTARRLRAFGAGLDRELTKRVKDLHANVATIGEFQRWLMSFEGVGPKTLKIFLREAGDELRMVRPATHF